MNSTRTSLARTISTGFVVSLIFSIVLFWANAVLRKIGRGDLVTGGRDGPNLKLAIDLGDESLLDPNVAARSPQVFCNSAYSRFAESDIFLDRLLEAPYWIIGYEPAWYSGRFGYEIAHAEVNAEWHAEQGLIVAEQVQVDLKDETPMPRIRYVGPKGFGDTSDGAIGRFSDPQLCGKENPSTLFVYDRDLKMCFRIDFALGKVTSESWADKSIITTSRAYFTKFGSLLQMHADGASRWETDAEMEARLEKAGDTLEPYYVREGMYARERWAKDLQDRDLREQVPFGPRLHGGLADSDPWAMDDQGTIYTIDRVTLLLSDPKGQLPRCGREKTCDPSRLLAYSALPLFVDKQYFGLVAASLSRDGSDAVMVLLDSKGHEKDRTADYLRPHHYRYGLVTSHVRTVLDFAQPLVFSAASSLWGPRTEAIAGYRSLFVLPMSMPGRIAGDKTLKAGDRYGTLVMWNVLTWTVGLLLAIAVIRDLKQHGMSGKTQKAWLFACMGFGWIAVITYLLTRPRLHFVTCTGCGHTRRTDQVHCLHCEADWDMCELQTPGWRVVE